MSEENKGEALDADAQASLQMLRLFELTAAALDSVAADRRIATAAAFWRGVFQNMLRMGRGAPADGQSLVGLALLNVPDVVVTSAYVNRINVFHLAGFILRHVCEDTEFVEEGAKQFARETHAGSASRPGFTMSPAVHTVILGPEAETALTSFMETHARDAGFSVASLLRSLLEEDFAQAARDPDLAAAVVVSAMATEETGRVGCWEGGVR